MASAGDVVTLRAVRAVVGCGVAAVLALAFRLFLDHPYLTSLSAFGSWPRLRPPFDALVLAALAGLLVPVILLREPRAWTFAWCALLAARMSWDAALWQPYLLQYGFMMLACATALRRGPAERASALRALRLVMVAIYAWSGLAKLHWTSLSTGWTALLGDFDVDAYPLWLRVSTSAAAAGAELGLGLLLATRWRRAAVIGLTAMHAAILLALGPLGRDVNRVVWPWNLVMVALLFLLFWPRAAAAATRAATSDGEGQAAGGAAAPLGRSAPRLDPLTAAALLLFGLGPLLSYAHAWSTSLSFRLYSLRGFTAYVGLTGAAIRALPPDLAAQVRPKPLGGGFVGYLNLSTLAERALGAQPPPDHLVYRRIGERLLPRLADPAQAILLIHSPPPWWSSRRTQYEYAWRDGLELVAVQ